MTQMLHVPTIMPLMINRRKMRREQPLNAAPVMNLLAMQESLSSGSDGQGEHLKDLEMTHIDLNKQLAMKEMEIKKLKSQLASSTVAC